MKSGKALKALAEPRRQEMLLVLNEVGELSVGDLANRFNVTQQAISLHLQVLQEAGLVEARREGTRHIYAIRPEGFAPVRDFVELFWSSKLSALKRKLKRP